MILIKAVYLHFHFRLKNKKPDMSKSEISYQDAVREIEEIIRKIESGELNVDQLTDKVKKATLLLEICRKKLKTADEEISRIIEGMKEDSSSK